MENNNVDNELSKYYVSYAGLIITYPFLIQLFKSLDYLDLENQFKNQESQWRAVYVVNFLATGNHTNIEEVMLAMPKVLCGMKIQDPIPKDVILNTVEMQMAESLLTAIIERWVKLGETSFEGLRATFLMRNGSLEITENGFQLQVENNGVDILLDFLPWNISVTKLPWQNRIIYTSWR